ncbi:MAG TPA: M28 family peptidase [Chloroflexaceae bacterium]|nr:M28 family peptidase [Chloroflexaceae bacterium]
MNRLRSLALLAWLSALVALALLRLSPPAPLPANAPIDQFSAERALALLRVIAAEPHPTGSPSQLAAEQAIVRALEELGLRPEIQATTAVFRPFRMAGSVRNILVRLPGSDSTGALLLAAHYDSVAAGPGAGDDGSGVAALVETLRALRAGPPLRNDLIVLLSDGEEPGLLGAAAFMDEHPWAADVALQLNFEAGGHRGPLVLNELGRGASWLIDGVARAAPHPVATSAASSVAALFLGQFNSDARVFDAAGVSVLGFTFFGGTTHYHTALDTPERLDLGSLQHDGATALALARYFGNQPLPPPRGGEPIFFDLLGAVLIHYPAAWAPPLLLATLLCAALLMWRRRAQFSVRGVGLGALLMGLGVAAAAGGVWGVWALLAPLVAPLINGTTYAGELFCLGFAAAVVALVLALYGLFRRRASAANLALGALLWWLTLATLSSLLLPAVSYLLQWPLLAALASLAVTTRPPRPSGGRWSDLALAALAAPPLLILAPGVTLFFTVLPLDSAWVVAVPIALGLGLLFPLLERIAPYGRWLPPALGAAAAGLLLAGVLGSRFGPEQPRPNSVAYALDSASGAAFWFTADPALDSWTAQFFPAGAERADLSGLLGPTGQRFLRGPASVAALAPPTVEVLADTTQGTTRTLALRLCSPRSALNLRVLVSGAAVRQARLNGRAVEGPDSPPMPASVWMLRYYGLPPGGALLTLELDGSSPIQLTVVDQSNGFSPLPEAPGPRPAGMMPAPTNVRDPVYARTVLKVP